MITGRNCKIESFDYKVIQTGDLTLLIAEVKQEMAMGWIPCGYHVLSFEKEPENVDDIPYKTWRFMYSQALYKIDKVLGK